MPQRKLSETRRSDILRAAARTIGERGICDTRIADVAEAAGASPALVIYYFGSKDRLLAEALAYADERFYELTARELDAISSARDRLARLIELSCSTGPAGAGGWEDEWVLWLDMWARAPRDPEVARDREALDRRWRDAIADIVRDGQASGEFGPASPKDFAVLLGALIDGLAIQVVLGDPEVTADRMFQLCMELCARELGFRWKRRRRVALRRTSSKIRRAASR